jgi:molecular chaperone GrpE
MADPDDKGAFEADIPAAAVEEALRSVERIAGARPDGGPDGVPVEVEPPAEAAPDELTSLRAQLELSTEKGRETLEKLRQEHERYLRAAADLENYKKRAAREREEIQKFGNERLLADLLPAVDGLDRAIAAATAEDPLAAGVRLVRATLEQALARHGVAAFSAMGERFDPARHEALLNVPTADRPPGTVVLEHARGFTLNGRLVRPAMVGVAVEPREEKETEPSTG